MAYKEGLCQRHVRSSPASSGRGVRIVRETGRLIAQVARELGINAGTLGNWVAKDRAGRGDRQQLSEDEQAELARLRKENTELRMERDDVLIGPVRRWLRARREGTSGDVMAHGGLA